MYNLLIKAERDALALQIKSEIDEYCSIKYDSGYRSHMGMSTLGEECDRKLYLAFRWCGREKFSGRMQRLFQVGHLAEPRFIEYLEAIGFTVYQHDTNGKQFRVSGVNGHYGGSCDGVATREGMTFLLEFKTSGTGAGFDGVVKKGVKGHKPKHWIQMCQYGRKMRISHALYLIENKNDSDLTIEIAELDHTVGERAEARADRIINGALPAKFASSPAHSVCKYCPMAGICHRGEAIEKNCRSCIHSKPVEDAQWFCGHWGAVIPKETIPAGCGQWVGVL